MARRHWKLEYAAKFVGKWEGLLTTAYLDEIASPPVWTIGYGHTSAAGAPNVHAGMHVTEAEATKILAHDLGTIAHHVSAVIHHELTFRQRIALISFGYNLGPGAVDDLAPLVNAGKIKQAADKMLEYDHAGGVVVQGLLNRRRAERWLMLHTHLPNPHRARPIHPKRKAAR
jgi:lysozyme